MHENWGFAKSTLKTTLLTPISYICLRQASFLTPFHQKRRLSDLLIKINECNRLHIFNSMKQIIENIIGVKSVVFRAVFVKSLKNDLSKGIANSLIIWFGINRVNYQFSPQKVPTEASTLLFLWLHFIILKGYHKFRRKRRHFIRVRIQN